MKDTRKYHVEDYDKLLHEKTHGNIVRIGEFINSTTAILHHCNKHNKDFYPRPTAFINKGQIGCRWCSMQHKYKTQEEFERDINDVNPNISVIGVYIKSSVPTKLKCNICGYEWQSTLDKIKEHKGCPACSGVAIQKGLNDLWTKNPEMAKLLKNQEDGYKLGEYSRTPTNWICPYCGEEIKNRTPNKVRSNGINCSNCTESLSYPEKFFREFLKYMKIDFKSQKIFDWAKNKKYDFYFDGIICETHGLQHYEKTWTSAWKRDLETEQNNDKLKKSLAFENGFTENTYIELDCRRSDAYWIIQSIQNSVLSKIYDLSNVDWKTIEINAITPTMHKCIDLYNKGYSTYEITKELNFSEKSSTVSRILGKCAKLGICDYDPKESRRKASAHSVVLTNTGEIFEYIEDAIKKYGRINISACCRGQIISAGKMDDGSPMIWRYSEDYDKNEDYSYNNKTIKKIICLETEKVYDKIIDAANEYNIKDSAISSNLTRRQKYAGRDKDTLMPLHWMYYDEYLNSTKEQIKAFIDETPLMRSSIICLNTNKIYQSASQALQDCGLKNITPITDCCKKKRPTAGSINGEPAMWMYYKEYIESDLYKNQVA